MHAPTGTTRTNRTTRRLVAAAAGASLALTVGAGPGAALGSPAGGDPAASPAVRVERGLPANPVDYATATFEAWRRGDERRLRWLATPPAAAFLAARAADDAGAWRGPACEGAAGSTYCTWAAPDAQLVLRVANEAAGQGQPRAVTEAYFTVPPGGVAVWPFTTEEQARNTQAGVDEGHQPWLLGQSAVASFYALAELGWEEATVEAVAPPVHQVTDPVTGAQADLTLAQPVRQGQGGIWAVVRAGSVPAG